MFLLSFVAQKHPALEHCLAANDPSESHGGVEATANGLFPCLPSSFNNIPKALDWLSHSLRYWPPIIVLLSEIKPKRIKVGDQMVGSPTYNTAVCSRDFQGQQTTPVGLFQDRRSNRHLGHIAAAQNFHFENNEWIRRHTGWGFCSCHPQVWNKLQTE